jgi:hypothetical protein
MSHNEVEENQVDYVPDSEKDAVPDEFVPKVSCKRCIHKDVCYFLTSLDQNRQAFKCSGICELPYDINILATTCKKFDDGKSIADKMTEHDDAPTPEDEIEVVEG